MSERRALAIAAVAAVAVTLLYTVLLLRPKLAQISQTREQVTQAESEETRLRGELERLRALRKDAPATIARLARISRYLPSAPELPAFIRAVQAAATQAGVDLRSIAPAQPGALTGSTGVETINVTLVVEGGYFRMQDFLARMERLERIVQITAVTFSPKVDKLSPRLGLAATFSLTMYVVQPDATLRTAAAASPSPSPGAS